MQTKKFTKKNFLKPSRLKSPSLRCLCAIERRSVALANPLSELRLRARNRRLLLMCSSCSLQERVMMALRAMRWEFSDRNHLTLVPLIQLMIVWAVFRLWNIALESIWKVSRKRITMRGNIPMIDVDYAPLTTVTVALMYHLLAAIGAWVTMQEAVVSVLYSKLPLALRPNISTKSALDSLIRKPWIWNSITSMSKIARISTFHNLRLNHREIKLASPTLPKDSKLRTGRLGSSRTSL